MTYEINVDTHNERKELIAIKQVANAAQQELNEFKATYTQDVSVVFDRLKARTVIREEREAGRQAFLLRKIIEGEEHYISELTMGPSDDALEKIATQIVLKTGKKPIKTFDDKQTKLTKKLNAAKVAANEATDKLESIDAAIRRWERMQADFCKMVDRYGYELKAEMAPCATELIDMGFNLRPTGKNMPRVLDHKTVKETHVLKESKQSERTWVKGLLG